MEGCLFCRIVRKEIPAKIASESAKALAFYDVNPQAPLHVLVIPKGHIANALDIRAEHSEVLSAMILLAQDVARSEGASQSGFRLVMNCGPDAGQAVDHLHLHLLGRRKLKWPPG